MVKIGSPLKIDLESAGYDIFMERLFERDTAPEVIEESTGYSFGELTNITTQAASFIINETGTLILDLTTGSESAQYFDFRPKNANYGLLLKESDGTGSIVFSNFYDWVMIIKF